jgi:HEAT repeat protein
VNLGVLLIKPNSKIETKKDLQVLKRALRYKRSIEPLIQALKDENPDIRASAANALGYIGDIRAVEPLILALNDDLREVRMNAAMALGKIGDSRALQPLIRVIKENIHDSQKSATVSG